MYLTMKPECKQGTARWMRCAWETFDGVTRITLVCGSSSMLLLCLPDEGLVWEEPRVTVNRVPKRNCHPCTFLWRHRQVCPKSWVLKFKNVLDKGYNLIMDNNKFKSALLKNSTVGFISQLLNSLFTLVTRNIFIKYIGVELLGLNSTLASVFGMLSLAELGFQSAIVFNLYKPLHDGNQIEVNSIMNILKIIYRGVG